MVTLFTQGYPVQNLGIENNYDTNYSYCYTTNYILQNPVVFSLLISVWIAVCVCVYGVCVWCVCVWVCMVCVCMGVYGVCVFVCVWYVCMWMCAVSVCMCDVNMCVHVCVCVCVCVFVCACHV